VGTITRKELEYDGARADVPALNIPQGTRGLVHIWGRNDTDTTQRMGMQWAVSDPDNIQVESYTAWEAWPYTSSGGEHEFIGGRFDLSKVGTYRIAAVLLMNFAEPVAVDFYEGDLCTVAAVAPEAEFSDFAITSYEKV